MADILGQLGFKKRTHVGISISTNNFVELVCIDKGTRCVVKYAYGNVKYNNAVREIMDFEEFTEVIEGLFAEAGLKPNECAVTLNLPNVHFDMTAIEANYETPYIIENIQTEIEDLYIFKRSEPAISYTILGNAKARGQQVVAYSAMQSNMIGRILEIFDSLQIELVRIDCSHSSLLKALQYCDRFSKYFQKEEKTSIILITQSSCCVFYMNANEIVDYVEEPIAVKALSTEEVNSTVSKLASNSISKNSPRSVLIISETDEVNAEEMASNLDFAGDVDFLNRSINSSDSFIDVAGSDNIDSSMISYITIEAVGAAVADFDDYPLKNYMIPPQTVYELMVEVGGFEVDLIRFAVIVVLAAVIAALVFGSLVKVVLQVQTSNYESSIEQNESEMGAFKRRIDDNAKKNTRNVFPVLKKIIESNNAVISAYSQLSTDIPDDVYIKKFATNSQGGIGILGEAKSSELVETFVKRLREKNADLMVSGFSINTDDSLLPGKSGNGRLTFEIKTASKNIVIDDQAPGDLIEQSNNNQNNNNPNPEPAQGNVVVPPPPVI